MPDASKLIKEDAQANAREVERQKADKARLRKLRRAGDIEALANELIFQIEETQARRGHSPREKRLKAELQNVRGALLFAQLEKQSLQSEVLELREVLGDRDGVIELSGAKQTPRTISSELTALGFAVPTRTVQSWLKQFYDAKKSGLRPTRYEFEGNERGRAEVSAFLNWCQKTRKIHKKRG